MKDELHIRRTIGRRGKTQGLIINSDPLTINVTKNGRPVKEFIALNFLSKHFPNIKNWKTFYTDHSLKFVALGEKQDE